MVANVEVREMKTQSRTYRTYGTIGHTSQNLMKEAWQGMKHVFSISAPQHANTFPTSQGKVGIEGPRYSLRVLNKHPVDLLVVECGHIQDPRPKLVEKRWEHLLARTEPHKQPHFIFETWPPNAQLWEQGPVGKASRKRWTELGYATRTRVLDAQYLGGAIVQPRTFVVREKIRGSFPWMWAQEIKTNQPRPMSNLLTPPGLLPRRKASIQTRPETFPNAETDPMPGKPGGWIRTERGPRRLLLEETARGLGISKGVAPMVTPTSLVESTSIFHWEYISQCLMLCGPAPKSVSVTEHTKPKTPTEPADASPGFPVWKPPDMTPGSAWYVERVHNLRRAVQGLPDAEKHFLAGLEALDVHRNNYDKTGPDVKTLQLLWWEFPPRTLGDLERRGTNEFP